MTAEAKAGKIIPAPVKEVVLEIAEEGFAGDIGSVRWSEMTEGGLYITAVAVNYRPDLIGRFIGVQEKIAPIGGDVVLALMPESHVDSLRPEEFCVQLTPPDRLKHFLSS